MSFFPVIERELRAVARSPRIYWSRCSAAFVSLTLVAWFWLTYSNAASTANSLTIFGTLSTFAYIYALAGGLFLTADSISEEKREGTLGLLFLTDLSGFDVALGKLVANSMRAIYGLVAIFPILTIPLLLGGIEFQEVGRMALVLINTLLFSLTAGLLVSSWSRQDRKAQFGALALVAGITGGPPLVVSIVREYYRVSLEPVFYALSPAYSFGASFAQVYKTHAEPFWLSVAVTQVWTWLFFLAAGRITRRVWQDRPRGIARGSLLQRFQTWRRGSPERRRSYREALLRLNPCYWLAARDRLKPWYVLWFLIVCAMIWFGFLLKYPREMLELEAFFACAIILHAALKVWIASEAGRQLHDDRKSGALELTLSTPLPSREILEGHFFALLRQFGPAVGLVVLFDLAGVIAGTQRQFGGDSSGILGLIAITIIFLLDAATIGTAGMWLGLSSRRSGRAVVQTLFIVVCLPWLILFALFTFIGVAGVRIMETMNFFVGSYFMVSLVVNLVVFLGAAGNLSGRLREIATRRFDSGPPQQ